MSNMTFRPLARALAAAGSKLSEAQEAITYQDYLYEVCASGLSATSTPPMSEKQWEVMVDVVRRSAPVYASTIRHALSNLEARENED